jgi:DNA mismatch repair protein MutS2
VKRAALLDTASAHAIGFSWLRAAVAPASSYGEELFARIQPFHRGSEHRAQDRAERIARVASSLDLETLQRARDVMQVAPDVEAAVAGASMGDVLDDAHLLELQRWFDACEQLDQLTAACSDIPRITSDGVRASAQALERGRTAEGFYLTDGFDVHLAQARAALARAQAAFEAARGRAVAAVAAALGREISPPEFIVMRSDARNGLPAGVRVVREAPSYFLCELEYDESVRSALEARDGAAVDVAHAEGAVRVALAEVLARNAAALAEAANAFGEVDVLLAAARFTKLHACVVATVVDEELAFCGGRFVPLEAELASAGRAFTPIDLRLDGLAVLTGPNMGGKSVALRTCGFIATCVAYGLPVPAASARVPLFEEIVWLGIGSSDDDEPEGLLSSFAREVVRLRDVLTRHAKRIVLLDEFARTTTPREGKALLIAVIERFRAEGASGLAATHLGGVAEATDSRHYAVRGLRGIPDRPATRDLARVLETLAASMDYTLEEVRGDQTREADAIALASLLGIDDGVIEAAHRAMELE